MSYDSQTSTALVNKLRKDVDSLTLKIAVLTDSKPSGTSGGAGVAATWTTRDLNTIDSDPHSLVLDLSSNQFTLAAGAYQITAMAAYLHTGHTRMRLYDVTGGVVIGYGVSVEVSNQANIYNELNVWVQPHKDNVYRMDYYISTAGAGHLGIASSLTGISEIYAVCEITRLDTGMTKPTGGSGIQGAPGPAGPAGPPGPVGPSGSGTVTNVSASGTANISVATGTTTPVISQVAASGAQNGYMTSTYAAKLDSLTSGASVSSVGISGGTTGLTTTGGPVTSSGTITLAGTLAVTSGGTGAITAPLALANLGAYPANNPNGFNVGTVTNVTVTPTNGITASVGTSTTIPAISLGLGAITPTSVAATGTVTGTNLTGTHTGTSSGTNTGDQAIVLSGDVSGSGSTGITTTIANSAVTLAKLATLSANSRLLGSTPSGTSVSELILGSNLSITGNTLNAAGSGSGTVTSVAISGGTTGLTTSGSPITTSGTVTLGGNLAIANGGTGAATAGGALTTLGAYSNTNPSGFTSNVGTVTGTSVTTSAGVSGTVLNQNTTPAITITLGAIAPTSVAATGNVTGLNLTGTHTGTSLGTNTGDQTISLTGDVTGTGTGSFTATIGSNTVTYAKMQSASGFSRIVGSNASSFALTELSLGTNLSMTGSVINATGSGTGDVVGPASSNDGYLALYDGLTGKLIKQGAWRDFTNDFIGPAGSPSMTTGFPYIPKHAFPPSPSAVPINSTPGGTNGPLYLEVNTALFPNVNKLWVHNGQTVGGWKYVNLL